MTTLFLDALEPELVLADYGATVTHHAGEDTFPCPDRECTGSVRKVGRAFVCSCPRCNWRAGNLVDYLARSSDQQVPKLVDSLATRYPTELKFVGGLPWASVSQKISQQFQRDRALLQFMLEHRGAPKVLTGEMALALDKLRLRGVKVDDFPHTVILLTEAECRQLTQLVGYVTGDLVEFPWVSGAMVIPMWADFCTISHFEVFPLPGSPVVARPIRFDVRPVQLSFSGLWNLPGDLRETIVVRNPLEAAAMSENARYFARRSQAVGAVRRPEAERAPAMPLSRACYLFADGEDLRTAQVVRQITNEFTVGWTKLPEKSYDWPAFLVARVSSVLRNNFDTAKVRQDFACLSDSDRQELTAHLSTTGQQGLLDLLQKAAVVTPRVFVVRGAEVRDTADGYSVIKEGKTETSVTNFTLQFTHNVFFRQSSEVLHQGCLHFKGEKFPFLFDHTSLYSWQKLLAAARFAVNSRPSDTQHTPAIVDPSMVPFILQHLSMQASTVVRLEGIQQLGWARDRQRFDAPAWKVENGEWVIRETRASPDVMPLRQYDFSRTQVSSSGKPELSDLAGELFALLAAQVARYQKGVLAPPILFRDIGQTSALLRSLFLDAFHQTAPIVLSWNRREQASELSALGGYPALATGEIQESQIVRCPSPLFVVSSSGRALEGEFEAEDISRIAQLFPRVVGWLQSAPATAVPCLTTPLHEHNMLIEGCAILKAALGYHWTGAPSEYPACQSVFDRFTPATIGSIMRENFAAQRLVIHLRGVDVELRSMMAAELKKVDQTFVEGDFATMDLIQARSLLKSFFLSDPVLPTIDSTSPTQEQWLAAGAAVSF
jgi:hypothetical protein